jgi:hypothetical protein
MDKEEALNEFIKGLRIALNNSLAYSHTHPYFLKSVEEFKLKVDALFHFLSPIKINVTPDSLFIDGKYWSKPQVYSELGQILHQRKIKALEFNPGVESNELIDLFSVLSTAQKDALKDGGLVGMLKNTKPMHISLEELDYSSLLKGDSKGGSGDIWQHIFMGAVEGQDTVKINEIAGNFSKELNNINIKDIIEDEKLREDLVIFLAYLKENSKDKFTKCANELFNYISNSKAVTSEEELNTFKSLFKGLDAGDFASILWSQISLKEHPDSLSFALFSKFSNGIDSDKIASYLSSDVNAKMSLKNNQLVSKKVQDLLMDPNFNSISQVYRNTLSFLLKGTFSLEDFSFDRKDLRRSYAFILLELLHEEKSASRVKILLNRVDKEWSFIVENKDYEYIKYLLSIAEDIQNNGLPQESIVLKNRIFDFVEEAIWSDDLNPELEYLVGLLDKSTKGSQFYLNKMFQEGKLSRHSLSLFLRFFSSQLDIFYTEMESRNMNLEFLSRMVSILSNIDSDLSLSVLKRIYSVSNEVIKVQVLGAMQALSKPDKEFILSILNEESKQLRKEALRVLSQDEATGKLALGILLGLRSPWGSKNRLILENMFIVEELELKLATEFLVPFTKLALFWHKPLKVKAESIIEALR